METPESWLDIFDTVHPMVPVPRGDQSMIITVNNRIVTCDVIGWVSYTNRASIMILPVTIVNGQAWIPNPRDQYRLVDPKVMSEMAQTLFNTSKAKPSALRPVRV